MIVVAYLLVLGLIGYAVPRKQIKGYFILCSLLISFMFAFYNPPQTDDLYRYYGLFDIVKGMPLNEYIHSRFNTSDWLYNYLLNDYMQNSRTFMAILFVVSRIGIKEVLPILFALLTYIPLIKLICEVADDNEYSKQALCMMFVIILACVDVRFLTALRNMSAYAWFTYLLYVDLVKNRKRILCFVGYILLCELHMSCVVLLAIRLIILITNKRFRFLIMVGMISVFVFTEQLASLITTYFGGISFLSRLAKRMIDYNIGRTNYNFNGAIFFVGSLLVCLVCYLLARNRAEIKQKYELYGRMFIYVFAYTVGSIRQYDVLTRNCQLMVMLCIPFLMIIANDIHIQGGRVSISVGTNIESANNTLLFFLIVALVVFSFTFYGLFSYMPMQSGMRI